MTTQEKKPGFAARAVGTVIPVKTAKGLWQYTLAKFYSFFIYYSSLCKDRDPNSPDAPDLSNFAEVLTHWGIKKSEVPGVIRYLTRRMQIQVVISLIAATGLGIYGLLHDKYLLLLNAAAFLALAVVSAAANTWRIHVLTTKKFVFFKDFKSWLFS